MTGTERALALGVHIGFYVVMIALPLSGWIYVSAGFDAEGRPLVVPTYWFGLFEAPHLPIAGADEAVLPDGRRMSADRADRASKSFTEAFTKKYPEIAARSPVYAQLRNVIDMAVAAAYLQEHDAYGRTQWGAEALLDEKAYPVERHAVPLEVETAINAVWRQNRLLTPIGGGVTIQPTIALESPNLFLDEQGTVAAARGTNLEIPAGRWWW